MKEGLLLADIPNRQEKHKTRAGDGSGRASCPGIVEV